MSDTPFQQLQVFLFRSPHYMCHGQFPHCKSWTKWDHQSCPWNNLWHAQPLWQHLPFKEEKGEFQFKNQTCWWKGPFQSHARGWAAGVLMENFWMRFKRGLFIRKKKKKGKAWPWLCLAGSSPLPCRYVAMTPWKREASFLSTLSSIAHNNLWHVGLLCSDILRVSPTCPWTLHWNADVLCWIGLSAHEERRRVESLGEEQVWI